MPAEQALKRAQRRVGPGFGRGGGGSDSWRERLEESAALIIPVLLLLGLALAGGGFELSDRHVAGLATWLLVVAILVLGGGGGPALWGVVFLGAGLCAGPCPFSPFFFLWV